MLQSSFEEIEGQFSPDGQWLAYASNESGRYEIYVRTFPEAGGKSQVSVTGGVQPRWRRDGHELFFVAPDGRLMAVPIRLAPDTHALEAGPPVPLFRRGSPLVKTLRRLGSRRGRSMPSRPMAGS